MTFDTRLLTGVGVFGAVMEAGNFVRAADVLGLTPSGGQSCGSATRATRRRQVVRPQPA